MPCFCLSNINDFLANLELQLPTLLNDFLPAIPAIPSIPELPQLPQLASLSCGLPTFSQSLSMTFPELPSDFPIPSIPTLSTLEGLASLSNLFGISPFGLTAEAEFNLAIGSLNMCTPALEELLGMLQPVALPLAGLPPIAFTMNSVEQAFGVDLTASTAIPDLTFSLSDIALGFPSIPTPSMEIAANMNLTADLSALGRLFNVGMSLGFDLSDGEGMQEFSLAVGSLPEFSLPELTFSIPAWSELIGVLSTMQAAEATFGMNLCSPGVAAALSLEMPSFEMNLQALTANLQMPFMPPGEAASSIEMAASIGAQLEGALPTVEMNFSGTNPFALGGLTMPPMPMLDPLSLAFTFSDLFGEMSGTPFVSSVPCPNIFCVAKSF